MLTKREAEDLVLVKGFVKVPSVGSAPHRISARLLGVEGAYGLVKPNNHGHIEKIPLQELAVHVSKTVVKGRAPLNGNGNGHGHHGQPDPRIIVIENEPPLFWMRHNRRWSKRLEDATHYLELGGVAKARGRMATFEPWVELCEGDTDRLRVVKLSEAVAKYRPRNPLELAAAASLREPPTIPAPHATAPPTPSTATPAPAPLARFGSSMPGFEIADDEFAALRDDYREYESAIAVARDAHARVQARLARLSQSSNLGLALAGAKL